MAGPSDTLRIPWPPLATRRWVLLTFDLRERKIDFIQSHGSIYRREMVSGIFSSPNNLEDLVATKTFLKWG
jgi:hypothetical protein